MDNLSNLFQDSWKWLFTTLCAVFAYLHFEQKKLISSKVFKDVYEADKLLQEKQVNIKLNRLEFHLRLLCEKNGITYQVENDK